MFSMYVCMYECLCTFCSPHHRDKAIFGLLAKCVTSSSDISESLKAREELARKLDSKSALGEYLSLVFDFASFSIDNSAVVSSLTENLCKQNPILGKLEILLMLYVSPPHTLAGLVPPSYNYCMELVFVRWCSHGTT